MEELALHREKGLCFNYDEKFSRDHIVEDDGSSPQDLLLSIEVGDEA